MSTSILFVSCGPDVCDCINGMKELEKKYQDAEGDDEKQKEIEKEGEELEKKCMKLRDGKSNEEKKEMREQAKKC